MLQFCEMLTVNKAEHLTAAHSVCLSVKLNSLFDSFFVFHWDLLAFFSSHLHDSAALPTIF